MTTESVEQPQRSLEDVIAFARECVSSEGKQFKKSEVLAFMRDLVTLMDSPVDAAPEAPAAAIAAPVARVEAQDPIEDLLARYATEHPGINPEESPTGAIYLPPQANRYYTRPQAIGLAGRLLAIAR